MFHLSLRVAWHDNRWSGTVCSLPMGNAFLDENYEGTGYEVGFMRIKEPL